MANLFVHVELATTDLDKAKSFYQSLFDWQLQDMDMGGGMSYTMIGVGEGTWPTMRATLSAIGLDEEEFLAACDGSFKQGSRFDGWVNGNEDDSYYHPFTPPPDGTPVDLVSAWQALAPAAPFAPRGRAWRRLPGAAGRIRRRAAPDPASACRARRAFR